MKKSIRSILAATVVLVFALLAIGSSPNETVLKMLEKMTDEDKEQVELLEKGL